MVYPQDDSQGEVTLTVEAGIRNERGDRLEQAVQQTLSFPSLKPQVRFVGRGVILPDGKTLTIPFEAVNARSVHVTALRVYDDNMGQFLQVNKLDGNAEMTRVGRFLWRRTIALTGACDTGALVALRPGCHRADAQVSRRVVPAHPAADSGGLHL